MVADERIRAVLERMEREDVEDAAAGLPSRERSLAVGPEAGRVLHALAALAERCRALEIGASRGYSTLWLAAGARLRGGTVVSLEVEPAKAAAWRANVAEAGLADVASLLEGDARTSLTTLAGPFDVVLLDAWKQDYEDLFRLARPLVAVGGVIVADNVVSHGEGLEAYVAARQDDATLSSVTLPVGNGLELTTVLA